MKTKTFDCLKTKAEAQARRAVILSGFSEQERLDYYLNAHEALVQRQLSLRDFPPPAPQLGNVGDK